MKIAEVISEKIAIIFLYEADSLSKLIFANYVFPL